MSNISPSPSFAPVEAHNMWSTALDMPFSPLKTFAWGIDTGGSESFGLGTAIRGAITPAGNEPPPVATGNPIVDAINAPAAIRSGIEGIGRLITGQPNPPLAKDAYEQSPYYRKAIPWDPGMTEDRAAALASNYDIQTAKDYFGSKDRLPYLIGNFVGQAADPINYVPLFGESAQAAAVARFGVNAAARLGIRAGVGALDAASNTALFGSLTAAQRAKYGDDISWQAQINNIAMAAVIGGVLSPVVHAVTTAGKTLADLRAEASVQSKVETVPNVGVARAITNDAVTGLATEGEVKLSPASGAALERLSADITAKRDAAMALSNETRVLNELSANDVKPGKVVITPSGNRVEVRTEVVDLATLQAASGDLQVRDRTRAASAAQIEDIGRNLDPARLMPSLEADRGAPIVGPDNIVDSGNGRIAGIRRAYEAYPEQAQAYRSAIEARGYSTEGMAQPVLISRRVTPLSPDARAQFNAEANQPGAARMSATELAAMDRAALDDQTLRQLADGPVTSAENKPFVQRYLANLPPNERAALVDKTGALNADGQRRVENALIASAYGDVDAGVIARFAEATDDNTRSIVGAMSDVAGKWALMRRAIKAGELSPEFDVTPELTSGLRKLSAWREAASRENRPVSTVIKEGMGQLDMLDGEMSLEAKTMIRAFYKTDEFKQGAGRDAIAARLSHIVDAANDLGRPQLFGDAEALTKLGVLEHAIDRSEADLFASADAGTGTDGLRQGRGQRPAGTDRGNGAQGAQLDQSGGPERSGSDAAGLTDTKIVDASGAPLLVYHGTRANFEAFDVNKAGSSMDAGKLGRGIYFSARKDIAGSYGDNIKAVFLDIKNPLIFDAAQRGDIWTKLREKSAEWGIKEDPVTEREGNTPNPAWAKEFTEAAQAHGFDGVMLKFSDGGHEIVAFDAKQVIPAAEQQKVLPFPEQPRAPATDMSPPRPDVPPDGLREAAARVGTAEDYKALAAQHGVSEDGSFPEMAELDAIKDNMSEADKAELEAADQTVADAKAWGDAILTAARCAFGV